MKMINELPDFTKLQEDDLKMALSRATEGMEDDVFSFVSSVTPMVNVDLFVEDPMGKILLAWRDDGRNLGWHIPGGIVRFKETFEERIQKTAVSELGTTVTYDPEPLKVTEIFMPYQRRGHFISFLYRCYPEEGFVVKNVVPEGKEGFLQWHSEMPENLVEGQQSYYDFLKEKFGKQS